jgi:hypothetical protein
MWMVNPKIMCNKHLLGEHVELHMFIGTIKKNKSLDGYVKNNLLEEDSIHSRHDALVKEMIDRNMIHKSNLEVIPSQHRGIVNRLESYKELISRCVHCRNRALGGNNKC